ncbi:unknown similar to AMEV126 [Mythimna separata entomopoxvirus 'L']|uniref:Uncharacterized protein n=1 Tax=Mythimna separata entomopoxvirus 'L' TaxID=1293572 RepID=A0A916KQ49_9POXV|nr:unknown similar to AMEV126 [Mythimna separata entomopoxvirus 'L']CCU56339.1 unknown similar to AMEV126 [Mythimna separata entomopoxvirus 'L']
MDKYIDKILYVRNLFFNWIIKENMKYYNSNSEYKIIYELSFLWSNLTKDCNIEYFYDILEKQRILNWRLNEFEFTEYSDYYNEFIMLLLDINCGDEDDDNKNVEEDTIIIIIINK